MDTQQVRDILAGKDPSEVGISQLDAAKLIIANALNHNDDNIKFESPIRIQFDYITEDNYDTWDEANVTEITYYTQAEEIWVTTDDEYYGEIPLDSLWASSIIAIAQSVKTL